VPGSRDNGEPDLPAHLRYRTLVEPRGPGGTLQGNVNRGRQSQLLATVLLYCLWRALRRRVLQQSLESILPSLTAGDGSRVRNPAAWGPSLVSGPWICSSQNLGTNPSRRRAAGGVRGVSQNSPSVSHSRPRLRLTPPYLGSEILI
jgi:hypothetical protein